MAKTKNIIYIIFFVGISYVLWSCNTSGCLENRSSIPLAGFYSSATGQTLSLDSLLIYGLNKPDSTDLNTVGTPINSIYLPMRSTMESTGWVISYKWKYLDSIKLADTINFKYSSLPYFASDECGVIYKYNIEQMEYTKHLIDSVILTDSIITNLDIERIKIYFRTE